METIRNPKKFKAKILIVENDAFLAAHMKLILTSAECDVQVAQTGESGMEIALEQKFDLILLNVDLPGIKGFQICCELKQRHFSRHTPIVFLSERPCEKDIHNRFELGAADYIATPFETSDFVARILSRVKNGSDLAIKAA